jgi:alkylhydroperoxidase family enzyme
MPGERRNEGEGSRRRAVFAPPQPLCPDCRTPFRSPPARFVFCPFCQKCFEVVTLEDRVRELEQAVANLIEAAPAEPPAPVEIHHYYDARASRHFSDAEIAELAVAVTRRLNRRGRMLGDETTPR